MLNLDKRDGIASIKEEPGYLIITLRNVEEIKFITNKRKVYEAQIIINENKEPSFTSKILNQFINGAELDYILAADQTNALQCQVYNHNCSVAFDLTPLSETYSLMIDQVLKDYPYLPQESIHEIVLNILLYRSRNYIANNVHHLEELSK